MPFKLNHGRRHHIPRQRRKVVNWRDYDAGLRRRGSLTVWFTAEAIAGWQAAPRTTPGGQPCHSPLAILTALTLRAAFRLALRQAEGLIGSVIGLLGLALRVPDHSTLSRRAATLAVPRPTRSSVGADGESEPLFAQSHAGAGTPDLCAHRPIPDGVGQVRLNSGSMQHALARGPAPSSLSGCGTRHSPGPTVAGAASGHTGPMPALGGLCLVLATPSRGWPCPALSAGLSAPSRHG